MRRDAETYLTTYGFIIESVECIGSLFCARCDLKSLSRLERVPPVEVEIIHRDEAAFFSKRIKVPIINEQPPRMCRVDVPIPKFAE